MNKEKLYQYLLLLGDNSMILGQRLGELCGHGPELETDIALTNISLDLFGQVRNYFQYAAEVQGEGKTEDDVAMMRYENQYRNTLLVEQPNTDFAFVMARQFLFDVYHQQLLNELMDSNDETIVAIAKKSIKEVDYHVDFSSTWLQRLGDGTEVSHDKMQHAFNEMWRFSMELFHETDIEKEAKENGVGADLDKMKVTYISKVKSVLSESNLTIPEGEVQQFGGKTGRHTEYMGYILSEFQYMQRAYPQMKW
jgi:ring-1,2-phenylacetyl-CoA epoxidase subunit PaaC